MSDFPLAQSAEADRKDYTQMLRDEMAERIFVDWVERLDEYAGEKAIRGLAEKSILAANIFFDVLEAKEASV